MIIFIRILSIIKKKKATVTQSLSLIFSKRIEPSGVLVPFLSYAKFNLGIMLSVPFSFMFLRCTDSRLNLWNRFL